jgi:ribosomal protein S18 acetylase RimI-like enzyme
MYIPESHPHLGIEVIPTSDLDDRMTHKIALELGSFMRDTVQHYYIEELGLTRIDPDPEPATYEDIEWRMQRIRSATEDNHEYMIARYISDERANDPRTAIAGLLATKVHYGDPAKGQHSIEVMEWDVVKSERGDSNRKGLGGVMLRHKFKDVDDAMQVMLGVADANVSARRIYEHYGFTEQGETKEFGIFDVQHIPMAVSAAVLKQRLKI